MNKRRNRSFSSKWAGASNGLINPTVFLPRGAFVAFLIFLASASAFGQTLIVPRTPISPTQPTTTLMREGDTFVRLSRTGPQAEDLSFNYWTVPGTATAGADFQSVSGVRSFPAWTTGGSISLQIYNDTRGEYEETFQMFFQSTDGQPLGSITIVIESNDLPEPTYNPLPVEEMRIGNGLAMTLEGKFLTTEPAPGGGSILRRFFANGTLDESFQPFHVTAIRDAIPFSDGGIILGTRVLVADPYMLRRVNVDGTEDTQFQQTVWADVAKIVRAPDGKYYILKKEVGQTNSAYSITRLLSNGAVDETFAPLPTYYAGDLDVASDGTLYVVGNAPQASGGIFRLQADGTIDGRFVTSGRFRRVDVRGTTVYAVRFENISDDGLYLRLTSTGAVDPAFAPVRASRFWAFPKWDSQERLYSLMPSVHGQLANYEIRRYRSDGAPDPTYVPGLIDNLYSRSTAFMGLTDTALYFNVLLGRVPIINGTPIATGGIVRIALEQEHPKLVLSATYPAVNNNFLESTATALEIARTGPNDVPLNLRFRTRSGAALENADFARAEGEFRFLPGITRQPIPVHLINDNSVEPNENFFIDFTTETGEPFATVEVIIQNDDLGLAINHPTILPDGTWRVRFLHDLPDAQPVRTSTDLVNWSTHPTHTLDGKQYIDIAPDAPMRFFATERFPERALVFP